MNRIQVLIRTAERLPGADAVRLGTALIKEANQPEHEQVDAVADAGAAMDGAETALVLEFSKLARELSRRKDDFPFWRCDPTTELCGPPSRKDSLKMLLGLLSPIFGPTREKIEYDWVFRRRQGDWELQTALEVGTGCFSFGHSIVRYLADSERENKTMYRHITFDYCKNMGMFGSWWSIPHQRDLEACVESANRIAMRVMEVVPGLLEGLTLG